MNRAIAAAVLAVVPMAVALGEEPATRMAEPVRADAAAPAATGAQEQQVRALQQEVDRLRVEMQQLKAREAASPAPQSVVPVRAEPAGPPAPIPSQSAVQIVAPPPAVAPAASWPLPPGTVVGVSRVSVTSTTVDHAPGLHVVAYVTIQGLPNVPFTFQAALVTPDEKVHTDVRGEPYVATREVSTGDAEDTDDYGVNLSIKDLFSSNPPADLFVQVRIIDSQGRIVAKSGLHSFRRPWN